MREDVENVEMLQKSRNLNKALNFFQVCFAE